MTSTQRLILTGALVGGICGAAAAALYVAWRAQRATADQTASRVVRQLESVADRMQHVLHPPLDGRGVFLHPSHPSVRP
jgi:gas vesicle protein